MEAASALPEMAAYSSAKGLEDREEVAKWAVKADFCVRIGNTFWRENDISGAGDAIWVALARREDPRGRTWTSRRLGW